MVPAYAEQFAPPRISCGFQPGRITKPSPLPEKPRPQNPGLLRWGLDKGREKVFSRLVVHVPLKARLLLLPLLLGACARTDIYYPSNGKDVVVDERGRVSRHHNRAVVLNGSDALGHTEVEVTAGGVRLLAAGGIDNSTSTKEGYRTIRHGVTAGALAAVGVAGINAASSSYGANQAAASTSNVAASKAGAATAASQNATTVRLAEIAAEEAAAKAAAQAAATAAPAAGSTINAVVPAVVTPVVP